MVKLVGTVELGDGLRLSAPGMSGEVELLHAGAGAVRVVSTVPAGCPRDLPDAASPSLRVGRDDVVSAALAAACTAVRTVELTPRSLHALSGYDIRLEVPAAGGAAVVLARGCDGVLSWHFPRPAGEDLVFEVPAAGPALMGAGGWLKKVLHVGWFRPDEVGPGRVGGFLVGRWEEENRPARLRRFTPDRYVLPCGSGDLITRQDLDQLCGRRVLLFVHGALGTSHGTFGALPWPQLARLWARYGGRVLAFDHGTVADSPQRSAERLLGLLPAGFSATFDIACAGRGAQVAAALTDRQDGRATVRRVFEPAPLPATPDTAGLGALLDHLTNAVVALPPHGTSGLRGEILAGLVGAAELVAAGAAWRPGSLPTYPAAVRDPGDVLDAIERALV